MSNLNRRTFVYSVGASAAIGSLDVQKSRAAKLNAKPVIAFIGCGGRSKALLNQFKSSTQVAWACDPDRTRAEKFQKTSGAKNITSDMRKVIDDPTVQAVVVATPDHWHAPAAIMACDAGKHVYVEKPCSHNLREGRLLVEAARRNGVIVQHGTQSRSNPLVANAIQILKEGTIGDVLMAKAWNVQRRRNIGHETPSAAPKHVQFDTWVGPAESMPFQSNRFHYDWHWWHNFGTGDIGNDGTHELDIARWGLGVDGLPSLSNAMGGKYYFDDDQQFPDTATCLFEWPGDHVKRQRKQLIFEMRIWSKNLPYNCDTGIEFYGTEGMLFVSKRGVVKRWNDSNQLVENPQPKNRPALAKSHQLDFLQAIESMEPPAADIEIGHDSTSLVHLANISVRRGRSLRVDPEVEAILDDPESDSMLARKYRVGGHWAVPQGIE